MPILTKDQVFEAVMELNAEERDELLERVHTQGSLELSEEHKQVIRSEIEAHHNDPTSAISRDELVARLRAAS